MPGGWAAAPFSCNSRAAPQLFVFHHGTGCRPPVRESEVRSDVRTPGNMAPHVDHAERGRRSGQAARMA